MPANPPSDFRHRFWVHFCFQVFRASALASLERRLTLNMYRHPDEHTEFHFPWLAILYKKWTKFSYLCPLKLMFRTLSFSEPVVIWKIFIYPSSFSKFGLVVICIWVIIGFANSIIIFNLFHTLPSDNGYTSLDIYWIFQQFAWKFFTLQLSRFSPVLFACFCLLCVTIGACILQLWNNTIKSWESGR